MGNAHIVTLLHSSLWAWGGRPVYVVSLCRGFGSFVVKFLGPLDLPRGVLALAVSLAGVCRFVLILSELLPLLPALGLSIKSLDAREILGARLCWPLCSLGTCWSRCSLWPLGSLWSLGSYNVLCHVMPMGSEHISKHCPVVLTSGVLSLLLSQGNCSHGSQHSFVFLIVLCIYDVWLAQRGSKKSLSIVQGSRRVDSDVIFKIIRVTIY